MIRSTIFRFAVCLLCAGQLSALGDNASPTADKIRQLIEQLGDDDYATRERASRNLVEIGYPAIKELTSAGERPEREVRIRARRILKTIREVDFQRRIEAFIAERDETESHGLPGWTIYRKLCGSDSASRELFVDMQKAEPDLMRLVDIGSPEAGRDRAAREQLIARLDQLRSSEGSFTVGTLGAILLASIKQDVSDDLMASDLVYQYCMTESIGNSLNSGAKRPMLRRLMGEWVGMAREIRAARALSLSYDFSLPEGLKIAERSLRSTSSNSYERFYAILVIAKFGDSKQIPLLEGQFEDRTDPFTFSTKTPAKFQVRDLALLTAIQLSKLDPKKYGFQQGAAEPRNEQAWFFENEAKRTEAFDKWKAFRAPAK